LFSIAFPEEWNWSSFYDDNGNLRSYDVLDQILRNPADGRDWSSMPDVLVRLAGWYEDDETEAFVRDIGTLFGGLADRFDAEMNYAVTGCHDGLFCEDRATLPVHVWAYLKPDGMSKWYTGESDGDANVHHWAWALTLGYDRGYLAVPINNYREVFQAGNPFSIITNINARADCIIGTTGALLGIDIRLWGASPNIIPLLWWIDMGV
jgi:hypothetical protein